MRLASIRHRDNARGLGIITGLTQGTLAKLAQEIERCQQMTDKTFGVNMTFLPGVTQVKRSRFENALSGTGCEILF